LLSFSKDINKSSLSYKTASRLAALSVQLYIPKMIAQLLSVTALVAAAMAFPDVTVKQLPAGCASYPGYNPDTGETEPFLVQVVDSENPAIEGFSDTSDWSVGIGAQGRPFMRWGYVSLPFHPSQTSL
jgi:hypothetical protein